MTTVILFLGQRLRPLEPITRIGDVLGLGRTKAFKAAGGWPLTGEKQSRRVIVPALADQLGIPYEVIVDEAAS